MNESDADASMPPMPDRGKRIRRIRKLIPGNRPGKGATQQELADLIARHIGNTLSRSAVTQWEAGGGMEYDNAVAIEELTGIDRNWIMNGPDDDADIPYVKPNIIEFAPIKPIVVTYPTKLDPEAAALACETVLRLIPSNERDLTSETRKDLVTTFLRLAQEPLVGNTPEERAAHMYLRAAQILMEEKRK